MRPVKVLRTRGDYRLCRAWPGWAIERRWLSGWTRIGGRLSRGNAWAMFMEMSDWQVQSSPVLETIMRGEPLPRPEQQI
jgi:hypothetical protein